MRPEDEAFARYMENPCHETQDALYKAVSNQARNIIFMILHRERLDLAANAATKAVLNLDAFKGDSAFSTWTHRIARNEAYDETTRLNDRNETTLDSVSQEHMPMDVGLQGYAAVLLEDLLKSLSKDDAALLQGKLFGLEDEELADTFGISEGAVRMRWMRLKEMVMKFLKRS